MEVNEQIRQQIEALLNIPSKTIDLKPLTDRLDALEGKAPVDLKPIETRLSALEAKPIPPNLSLDVATLQQSVTVLGQRITALPIAALSDRITTLEASVKGLFVVSTNPPSDDPKWARWLWKRPEDGKILATYYIRDGNIAIPIWHDPDYSEPIPPPSHANAVRFSDTEYQQDLIQGVSLIYTPKRDLSGQVGIRLFATAATFTSVSVNALDVGGAMIVGWSRSLTDFTGEVILITPPAQAVKIRISFTRPNNTTDIYEFPIS